PRLQGNKNYADTINCLHEGERAATARFRVCRAPRKLSVRESGSGSGRGLSQANSLKTVNISQQPGPERPATGMRTAFFPDCWQRQAQVRSRSLNPGSLLRRV